MFCGCYCGLCCACVLVSGLVTFGCYFPGDLLWIDFACASALYLMYCLFLDAGCGFVLVAFRLVGGCAWVLFGFLLLICFEVFGFCYSLF